MIFVRSIYRTIELIQGWEGYLITHEGSFIGLDAATMVIAVGIFNVFDPVFLLRGEDDHLRPTCEENELGQMDANDEKWQESDTVTKANNESDETYWVARMECRTAIVVMFSQR
ncbi:hypothetical protein BFJ72_g14716 [Fusarium proliferatum]|uniref:Uncharacterized protein n=1 Tax=Gibberella intermedia TaxID=948311 RepID=A0A420RZ19_GIBIN|nr:hypothetical protein BFJ72_g14716 [Fusarium proliferatum]